MKPIKHMFIYCLLFASGQCPLLAQENDIVEIVVTGRQPGPPLWRVHNGDNTLWILPLIDNVPGDMVWEDARVEAVIREADEAIGPPDISVGLSKRLLFKPFNAIRGIRLYNRLRENPDGATLADVLPHPMHERYSVLKEKYFPRNSKVDRMRPYFAAEILIAEILQHEQLVSSEVITRRVDKLIRRQGDIRITEVKVNRTLDGNYKEISGRIEKLMNGLRLQDEINCFESQLAVMERRLNDLKEAANAWATGNARDLQDFTRHSSLDDPCAMLLATGSEADLVRDLLDESMGRWMEAANAALENNRTTFTMLPMMYMAGDLSLLDSMAAMGYRVIVPN